MRGTAVIGSVAQIELSSKPMSNFFCASLVSDQITRSRNDIGLPSNPDAPIFVVIISARFLAVTRSLTMSNSPKTKTTARLMKSRKYEVSLKKHG
jgi:hypothetical protein